MPGILFEKKVESVSAQDIIGKMRLELGNRNRLGETEVKWSEAAEKETIESEVSTHQLRGARSEVYGALK